jgi:hypothetical protein
MKKIKLSSLAVFSLVVASFSSVAFAAQSSILPDSIRDLLNSLGPAGICASSYITSRVQFVLVLALGGIVLVAVAYALLAAFKYIRSEGESGKMEEAQKSIKAIFIGIAAMLIAIIGIVLVFAIFGAQQANPELLQTCINAPLSKACKNCNEEGSAGALCSACENAINNYCSGPGPSKDGGLSFEKLITSGSAEAKQLKAPCQ